MTTQIQTQEQLPTVSEVARMLRVDDSTVRRWIKTGALPAVAMPGCSKRRHYRIKRGAMNQVLLPVGTREVSNVR